MCSPKRNTFTTCVAPAERPASKCGSRPHAKTDRQRSAPDGLFVIRSPYAGDTPMLLPQVTSRTTCMPVQRTVLRLQLAERVPHRSRWRRSMRASRQSSMEWFPRRATATLGALRTVDPVVAVSRFVSPLNLKNAGTKILLCREGRHSSSDTKEGGWNRKIHRANEPAKYAPDKGRRSAPTSAGRFPAARRFAR